MHINCFIGGYSYHILLLQYQMQESGKIRRRQIKTLLLEVQKSSAPVSAEVILGNVQKHRVDVAVKLSVEIHTASYFVCRAVKTKADPISFPITARRSPQTSRSHVVPGAIINTLFNMHHVLNYSYPFMDSLLAFLGSVGRPYPNSGIEGFLSIAKAFCPPAQLVGVCLETMQKARSRTFGIALFHLFIGALPSRQCAPSAFRPCSARRPASPFPPPQGWRAPWRQTSHCSACRWPGLPRPRRS